MGLPQVLVVDDSEVILAFEREALSGHYNVSSARNGRQALDQLGQIRPAAVLLDLSMPELGGLEVLRTVKADAQLLDLPVIILSSEDHRRDECLQAGADEFLTKPVRAPDLLATVNRVIVTSQNRLNRAGMMVLFLKVGDLEFGVALDSVHQVLSETATSPIAGGPPHLRELVNFHGRSVLVLDTAARLGTDYRRPAADRMFAMLTRDGRTFCLRVDGVSDPESIPPDRLTLLPEMGGGEAALRGLLRAVARTDRGPVPILDSAGLISGQTLEGLAALVKNPDDRVST